jgi:hypothetical protein
VRRVQRSKWEWGCDVDKRFSPADRGPTIS